jgi:hypothetical protein
VSSGDAIGQSAGASHSSNVDARMNAKDECIECDDVKSESEKRTVGRDMENELIK